MLSYIKSKSSISSFIILLLSSIYVSAHTLEQSNSTFEDFVRAYNDFGNEKYMLDEPITQLSHVLQAAHIANVSGAPEDIIIGLLLHDIGQISSSEHLGDIEYLHKYHDELGRSWALSKGFSTFVADVIAYHTLIKVILVAEEEGYYESMSQASKDSYHLQKEKFSKPHNRDLLEKLKNHERLGDLKVARKVDEMAKMTNLAENKIPSMEYYKEMFIRVHNGQGRLAKHEAWKENLQNMYLSNDISFILNIS